LGKRGSSEIASKYLNLHSMTRRIQNMQTRYFSPDMEDRISHLLKLVASFCLSKTPLIDLKALPIKRVVMSHYINIFSYRHGFLSFETYAVVIVFT